MPVDVVEEYDELRAGLVRRLARQGTSDGYEIILANPDVVARLQYPDRKYPEKT